MSKRLTLELADEADGKLEELRIKIKAVNKAEVIRNALQLYEWALDEKAKGNQVGAVGSDKVLYTVNFAGG